MRHKNLIFLSSFLGGVLLFPVPTFALNLISPSNDQAGVEVDAYFQWQEVVIDKKCQVSASCSAPGEKIVVNTDCISCNAPSVCCKKSAPKYILDVDKFTQSEDNIPSAVCSADVCSFGFLDLTAGIIDFADEYRWRVSALDSAENPISSSPEWVFTTEQDPVVGPPPPVCGDNICETGEAISCPADCEVGDPGVGGTLGNPISAKNLTELFNKIFSFLFGFAIFIVPVIVIYAAFLMLMGGGDPVKLAKGRMILLWTAVAFIIILLSRGLPVVFKNLL
ncbi:MAG: pilin [bacterium]|nr:pilin [bacterium]